MLFSFLTNDYPIEMAAKLSPLDQSQAWSANVEQWTIVYTRLRIASAKLYSGLKNKV